MEKKRSLLDRLKRLFRPELKSKAEKKEKRRLLLFNRFKPKRGLLAITAPTQVTTLSEVQEAQSKHALAVAVATAAAADAAVAAAQAAAQVVLLTAPARPYHCDDLLPETAAIKIQTAFRGYLARKALKALKGLVRLQAMVRGQAVRRQTQTALKSLQVIVSIQSQVQASKTEIRQNKQVVGQPGKQPRQVKNGGDIKLMINCDDRRWDGSLLTKEEKDSRYASKKDAANRRERVIQYGYSHQKLKTKTLNEHRREAVPVPEAECERLPSRKSWLERWVDSQTRRRGPETQHLTSTPQVEIDKQIHHSNAQNQWESPCCEHLEETQFRRRSSSPICQRRTSFHHLPKGNTNVRDIDDASYTSSPAIPSYMASTASASARTRSTSTPKERTKSWESSAHGNSLSYYTNSFPSVNSDAGSARRLSRPSSSHQRSPRLKGLTVPVKSNRCWKDLSLDSECSFPNGSKNDKNFKR